MSLPTKLQQPHQPRTNLGLHCSDYLNLHLLLETQLKQQRSWIAKTNFVPSCSRSSYKKGGKSFESTSSFFNCTYARIVTFSSVFGLVVWVGRHFVCIDRNNTTASILQQILGAYESAFLLSVHFIPFAGVVFWVGLLLGCIICAPVAAFVALSILVG